MQYALSGKLWDTNDSLNDVEQEKYNKKQKRVLIYYRIRGAIAKPIKKIIGRK